MSDDKREDELTLIGRRKLMKLGAYAAPVILGTLTISRRAAAAGSGLGCVPSGAPCVPDGGTCEPDNMSCVPG